MAKIYINLTEIIETEKDIFLDTGARRRGRTPEEADWFGCHAFLAERFTDLDRLLLNYVLETYKLQGDMLKLLNVYTTAGVTAEMERFVKIVDYKMQELKEQEKSYHKNIKRIWPGHNKNKQLLSNILFTLMQNQRRANFRIFKPENLKIFKTLEKKVIAIGQETKSKVKSNADYGLPNTEEHNDEEIVASTIYHSLLDNKPSIILTCDGDIGRLLRNSTRHLCKDTSFPKDYIKKGLHASPVEVYQVTYHEDVIKAEDTLELCK